MCSVYRCGAVGQVVSDLCIDVGLCIMSSYHGVATWLGSVLAGIADKRGAHSVLHPIHAYLPGGAHDRRGSSSILNEGSSRSVLRVRIADVADLPSVFGMSQRQEHPWTNGNLLQVQQQQPRSYVDGSSNSGCSSSSNSSPEGQQYSSIIKCNSSSNSNDSCSNSSNSSTAVQQ